MASEDIGLQSTLTSENSIREQHALLFECKELQYFVEVSRVQQYVDRRNLCTVHSLTNLYHVQPMEAMLLALVLWRGRFDNAMANGRTSPITALHEIIIWRRCGRPREVGIDVLECLVVSRGRPLPTTSDRRSKEGKKSRRTPEGSGGTVRRSQFRQGRPH